MPCCASRISSNGDPGDFVCERGCVDVARDAAATDSKSGLLPWMATKPPLGVEDETGRVDSALPGTCGDTRVTMPDGEITRCEEGDVVVVVAAAGGLAAADAVVATPAAAGADVAGVAGVITDADEMGPATAMPTPFCTESGTGLLLNTALTVQLLSRNASLNESLRPSPATVPSSSPAPLAFCSSSLMMKWR